MRRELRKWQATNPHGRKFQKTLVRRIFLWAGRHPLQPALGLLLAYAISLLVSFVWTPPYPGLVNLGPVDPARFVSADVLGTVLATQAAVVGLVYAIVFAFTTIFLGKQTATKASVQSYLVTSGAKFLGVSSLTLVGALTVTLLIAPAVNSWTAFAWLCAASTWLVINIFLTVHFLTRTFEFATPEGRRRARDDYAVTIAWPQEWQRHAASVVAAMPNRFGLFYGNDYRDDLSGDKPAFSFVGFEMQRIEKGLRCSFKGRRQVSNVWYWPMQIAYNRWQLRAAKVRRGDPAGRWSSRSGPLFIARTHPEPQMFDAETFVVGTTAAPHLTRLELALCWASVSFHRVGRYDTDISVLDCLAEAQAECRAAMDTGLDEDFRERLLQLLDLLDALFESSVFTDDEGRVDNHALTSSNLAVWDSTVAHDWCRILEDLFTVSLPLILRTPGFSAYLVRTPKRLMTRTQSASNLRLRELFLNLQAKFLRLAIEWAGAELAAHRALSRTSEDVLPEPIASRYGLVLSEGIGAWESVKNEGLLPLDDHEGVEWGSWAEKTGLLVQHLQLMLGLLARSSYISERGSVVKLLGSAVRWRGQLDHLLDERHSYIENPWQITVESIKLGWQELKDARLRGYGADESMQRTVVAHALTNLWQDACAVMIATIAQVTTGSQSTSHGHVSQVVRAILIDSNLGIDDGSSGLEQPIRSPLDYIHFFIRAHVLDGGYRQGYQALLDGIAKECAPNDWTGRVSGRIFSLRGPDSVQDVLGGMAFSLALLARDGWQVDKESFRAVFRAWSPQDEKRRSLRNALDGLIHELKAISQYFEPLWKSVVGEGNGDLPAAADKAVQGVTELLAVLNDVREFDLVTADIDQSLCDALARKISEGQPNEDRFFPLHRLSLSSPPEAAAEARTRTFTILGYPKGRLTKVRLEEPAEHEAQGLRQQLFARLRALVTREAIEQLTPIEKVAGGKSSLLSEITAYVEALGPERHAVLLVPALNEPKWLGELRQYAVEQSSGRAPEERFVREAGYGDERNYLGHLRGAAVYAGLVPAGQLLLLPRDFIQELQLFSGETGYVSATAEASTENPSVCKLHLSFTFSVKVGKGPCWRIQYRT